MPAYPTQTASQANARSSTASGRHLGLDGLRGIASLMVVVLHAAIPYLLLPMPMLLWSARDERPSAAADYAGWAIQCCVMPTFFVLSGYFAAGLLQKLGPGEFFRHRRQRLLVPLALGFFTVLPACLYIWVTGWVADGLLPPVKLLSLKFDDSFQQHVWGLAHLWFLEYLLIYSAVLAAAAALCRWQPSRATQRPHSGPLASWGMLAALMAAGAGVLWCDLAIVVGFQNTLAPVATKLAYFSLYFAYGLWLRGELAGQTPRTPSRWSLARWGVAGAAFALLLPLVHAQQQHELTGLPRAALAGLLALYAGLLADGLVRAAWRWRPQAESWPGRTLNYLAQASLWTYLVHLPVVALLQVDLATAPLPAAAKFAIVTVASIGIVLFWYQVGVRHTRVGLLLEGRASPANASARATVSRGPLRPAPVEVRPPRRAA